MRLRTFLVVIFALAGCKKTEPEKEKTQKITHAATAVENAENQKVAALSVGLVTDVGGRGDQSFNDAAIRGLENWAAQSELISGKYSPLSPAEWSNRIPPSLRAKVKNLGIKPIVVQSKSPDDYEANLQLLVNQKVDLVIASGFLLENALEAVAKRNPNQKFLLIDSPILDAKGQPQHLPNVKTIVFKEEEGSFLVGALAGLVSQHATGFVGGMEIPLIKKFEAGFEQGVHQTNPKAKVWVNYTGSFDNVAHGKQVAVDLLTKGADVIFHAAGADGLGVIQAVKESKTQGKSVYAIGVDSDQHAVAPQVVLTSMVKRVDLAVYQSVRELSESKFSSDDQQWGLKENGVDYAEIRVESPQREKWVEQLEALRAKVIDGSIKVSSVPAAGRSTR